MKLVNRIARMEKKYQQRVRMLMGDLAVINYEVAQRIMAESLEEVPRDTEAVAASAYIVEKPDGAAFGYGGPNLQRNPRTRYSTAKYAWIIHEGYGPNGDQFKNGKTKYFTDPVERHAGELSVHWKRTLHRHFK